MKVLLLFTLVLHARSAPNPEMKIIIHLHEAPAPGPVPAPGGVAAPGAVAAPGGVAAPRGVAAPGAGYGGAAPGGKDYAYFNKKFQTWEYESHEAQDEYDEGEGDYS